MDICMYDLRIINSGVPVLDSLLGGGFLSNSIIVVSLQSGTKYWELIHRIIYNNYEEKFHLILVTFHMVQSELLYQLNAYQKVYKHYEKVTEILSTGNISIINCFSIPEFEEDDSQKDNIHYVSNPFDVDNLLSVMAKVRESVPQDKQVFWIFHSLTNMSIGVPEDSLLKFCRRAFRYHKRHGDLAIYLLDKKAHSETFFAKIYQLSDVLIKLFAEETSWGLEAGIQVLKGVFPFNSKKLYYDIDVKGDIMFIENKRDVKPQVPPSTFSIINHMRVVSNKRKYLKPLMTGIRGLDSLLGGGMLSNSIVVVSYQYDIRILETLYSIFQNQLNPKAQLIQINYNFLFQDFETYLKIMESRTESINTPFRNIIKDSTIVIDCLGITKNKTGTETDNPYHLSYPFDVDKILSVMVKARSSVSEDKSVFWIFYTLTDMSIGVQEDELLKFCRRAFRYHKSKGDLAVYVLNEQAHSEKFLAKLYQMSDVFIKFISEDTPEGIDTLIQILKSPFNYDSKKIKYSLDKKGQFQLLE